MQFLINFLRTDSDNEVSRTRKFPDVTEEQKTEFPAKQSDIESESAGDDIEILEKPERFDIEKKLE